MGPRDHVVLGFLFSLLLAVAFDLSTLNFFVLFASSLLIDLDHVPRFIVAKRSFSIPRFLRFCHSEEVLWRNFSLKQRLSFKYPVFFFHGVEVLLLLLVLSFFVSVFFFVFLGFLLHLFFDYVEYLRTGIPLGMKFSLFYVLFRNRGKLPVTVNV